VASDAGTEERVAFWKDSSLDVWNDAAKHRTVSVEGVKKEVKFIVEFLCFVPPDDETVFEELNSKDGEPLYRITALADGNGDRAKVMLQSTYLLVEQK